MKDTKNLPWPTSEWFFRLYGPCRRGDTLEVIRRGKVVARIVPAFADVPESSDDANGWRKAPGWTADMRIEVSRVRLNPRPISTALRPGSAPDLSVAASW